MKSSARGSSHQSRIMATTCPSRTSIPNARARTRGRSTSPGTSCMRTVRISRTASSQKVPREPRSWVEIRIVLPSAARDTSNRMIVASDFLSTPANGSSSSSTSAFWAIPLATKARLRCPPESLPICRSAKSVSSTCSRACATASLSALRARRMKFWWPYRPVIATSRTEIGNVQSTSSDWGTYEMRPLLRACAGVPPEMETDPASGFTSPMIDLNSVDLPEPFIPMRPQIRPGAMSMSTCSRACTSP